MPTITDNNHKFLWLFKFFLFYSLDIGLWTSILFWGSAGIIAPGGIRNCVLKGIISSVFYYQPKGDYLVDAFKNPMVQTHFGRFRLKKMTNSPAKSVTFGDTGPIFTPCVVLLDIQNNFSQKLWSISPSKQYLRLP